MFLDLIQRIVQRVQAVPEKGVMGKEFRAKSKLVMQQLSEMGNDQVEELEAALKSKGYVISQCYSNRALIILIEYSLKILSSHYL